MISNRIVRWSRYWVPTLKENPQEALIKSHRLMLRAGLIRKLASGTYSYLPLGFRALQKAEAIVREEMNATGALEVLLPALHPAEIWRESGRLEILGEDMIHFKDRHGKENVLGPTHEEIITDLVRHEIRSYKQLPVTLYQIQTKFRDEMRPRSGVIRSREFIMKDAYSFHASAESLDQTYQEMLEAYRRVFSRCGLEYFVVDADPGAMGGSGSQEFVLFSDAGEDFMVQISGTDRVMSVEMASRQLKGLSLPAGSAPKRFQKVHTPGHSSVESVAQFLKKKPSDLVKTMIYEVPGSAEGVGPKIFAVLVRGDHEVSEYKVRVAVPGAHLASRDVIDRSIGSAYGFSGPVGLDARNPIPFYIDEDVLAMKDFVTGANENEYHLVGVNLQDFIAECPARQIHVGDFRQVAAGDLSPEGKALELKTAIELGHIFKLRDRYSKPMQAKFLDASGKEVTMTMGCYGIGVNRILAAAIEQHSDDKGISWPRAISPFQAVVILIDPKDAESQKIADDLAGSEVLAHAGIDLLIDDRAETAGVKFNDADLMGFPLRIVLGPKNLKNGNVELKIRRSGLQHLVAKDSLASEALRLASSLA